MSFSRRLPLRDGPFIDELALAAALTGLAEQPVRQLFLQEIARSQRATDSRRQLASRRGPVDPDGSDWDPRVAIATLAGDDVDEAIWLAYLTTFFGPDERSGDWWRATRIVYSSFGNDRLTFARVRNDPPFLRNLCRAHAGAYVALPRGNHRKFEPKDAEHSQGLLASVGSLLALARDAGGLRTLFQSGTSPHQRFERLMADLAPIISFSRTGRFDLLVLLGDLNIVALDPPRLYLSGSTGPLRGARRVMPALHKPKDLDVALSAVADRFAIPIAVFEDALCNWQKHL